MDAATRPLTPREREVLTLLVDGLTDREIAERLVLSVRTVHSHVAAIGRKTGCTTRTQIAVFALRNGLVPL